MTRRKILIVEDEILLGDECASHVENAGFEVAGPYSALEDVPQDLAGVAGAILDINVAWGFDLSADRSPSRNEHSGHPLHRIRHGHDPQRYATLPRVTKPNPCLDAVQELIRQLAN